MSVTTSPVYIMAKSDSFEDDAPSVKSIPFNGDLYHCYHYNGVLVEVRVRWDNMSRQAELVDWNDLSPELQNLIDDSINFGDK